MSPEIIAEIANIALTLSLIVAIVFGLAQIGVARRDRRERLTLETLRAFHSREFAELILFSTTGRFPQDFEEWTHVLPPIKHDLFSSRSKWSLWASSSPMGS